MRLNKFIASATGLSRRAADDAVAHNRVLVNGVLPTSGQQITSTDVVLLDNRPLTAPTTAYRTIILNKPAGYVCSREGQGNRTVYELLPDDLHELKPIGRLDKESSGLLLLTTDGQLAYELTHPKFQKTKRYNVTLNSALVPLHHQMISDYGIRLNDGISKLQLDRIGDTGDQHWMVTMHEGRNRQIRRTFESLGYDVTALHRVTFGDYQLDDLKSGSYKAVV